MLDEEEFLRFLSKTNIQKVYKKSSTMKCTFDQINNAPQEKEEDFLETMIKIALKTIDKDVTIEQLSAIKAQRVNSQTVTFDIPEELEKYKDEIQNLFDILQETVNIKYKEIEQNEPTDFEEGGNKL